MRNTTQTPARIILAIRNAIFVSLFSITSGAVAANEDPAITCTLTATTISADTGVPERILLAVSRPETEHDGNAALETWPWTVTIAERSIWFVTEKQAQASIFRHFKGGQRSFDIGCFQINYRWHGHAFSSIEEIFDPVANARVAAAILKELYPKYGSWTNAVSAYRSRTQKFVQRHKRRNASISDGMPDLALTRELQAPVQIALDANTSDAGDKTSLLSSSDPRGASLFPVVDGG